MDHPAATTPRAALRRTERTRIAASAILGRWREEAAGIDAWSARPAVSFTLLSMAIWLLLRPTGLLHPNEQNYFAMGAKFWGLGIDSQSTALFDNAPHRLLGDMLIGGTIRIFGMSGAQIVLRTLEAFGFAFALCRVLAALGLSALDGLLGIAWFVEMGQTTFGGEWLFTGFESKIVAYILVLVALADLTSGRYPRAAFFSLFLKSREAVFMRPSELAEADQALGSERSRSRYELGRRWRIAA